MFVLMRTLTYATLFVGFLFFYLPARVLAWAGVARPTELNTPQLVGATLAALGAALAIWCVGAFVSIGKGTPAPFDPPRHLVVRGPYQFVRNPMYSGAALIVAGSSLYYRSLALLVYGTAFLFMAHAFVVLYEEPTLRRTFGPEYTAYCARVHRWWPRAGAAH